MSSPPVNPEAVVLPELEVKLTGAHSSRLGQHVRHIVVHRWSDPTASVNGEVSYMSNPDNQVSAHFVYGGETGPDAGRCVQIVRLADKAWTECNFNYTSVSIECRDSIWLGGDPLGLYRLARIVAWLLRYYKLPATPLAAATVVNGTGFCRHLDLGYSGCGHLFCPTTSAALWAHFCERVQFERERGGFRNVWAV